METCCTLTSRRQWREFLARLTPAQEPEYRRRSERYPVEIGGVTIAFESNGKPCVRTGKLLNVSGEGLMLRQYQPIDENALVLVRIPVSEGMLILAGEVRHCTQTVGGYKVGVKLTFQD